MKQIIIDGQTYNLSETGLDIFPNDRIKSGLLYSALDIMNNCLDTIFKIMTGEFPKAFRPKLYVSNSLECNAFAYMGKDIIIHSGLQSFIGFKSIPLEICSSARIISYLGRSLHLVMSLRHRRQR